MDIDRSGDVDDVQRQSRFAQNLDLATADFFLFPKLETPMKGKRFATIEEIKEKSKQEALAGDTKKRVAKVFRGLEKMLA